MHIAVCSGGAVCATVVKAIAAHDCSGLVTYHKAGLVQVFEWGRMHVESYQNPAGGDSSSC
jgi:hypothetical protein